MGSLTRRRPAPTLHKAKNNFLTDWRLLQKEEQSFRGDPRHNEKSAGSYGQDRQRSEIVIVRLAS